MTSRNENAGLPGSPLTEEHFTAIVEAEAMGDEARKQIDLAKQAGFDVQDKEDRLAESMTKIRSIKNVYFPGR